MLIRLHLSLECRLLSSRYITLGKEVEEVIEESTWNLLGELIDVELRELNVGVLVKEGMLDIRLIALNWAGASRMVWEKLEPILPQLRKQFNYPRMWSETEYLFRELIKYMEEHPELAT